MSPREVCRVAVTFTPTRDPLLSATRPSCHPQRDRSGRGRIETDRQATLAQTMDDAKAMTRAGETVCKPVGSGWLAVRRSAKRAGQASADATTKAASAADRKLTERGVAPQQLATALAEGAEVARQEVVKTTRRARKKLART